MYGQTASITSGCAELKVQFTAPIGSTFFWDFGDGAFSDLQNPEHSYVQPGDFRVRVFDMEGGTELGDDILITVFPEVEFEVNADIRQGCAPLEVNFESTLVVDPDVIVQDIIWTFGDGASSTGANVSNIYRRPGTYDISLKVTTQNDVKCDNPEIFEQYIVVEGANTGFTVNREAICEAPATFIFVNQTFNDEDATYLWDFGNGESTTERDPRTFTYNEDGEYTVILETTTPNGCVTSFTKVLRVGSPSIEISNFSLCKNTPTPIINNTIADEFLWDFTNSDISNLNDIDVTQQSPIVVYSTPGDKNVTLTVTSEEGCSTTQVITLNVEDPNAEFFYDPVITCLNNFSYTIHAVDEDLASYQWINQSTGPDGVITTEPNIELEFIQPERDEFFYNSPDSIVTTLIATSMSGCVDTMMLSLAVQRVESIFIPDEVSVCAPATVTFEDFSFSGSDIEVREWDFGDGNMGTFGPQDTVVQHEYNTGGTFEVVLTVTNADGCNDRSREVLINVKEIDVDSVVTIDSCIDCGMPGGGGGSGSGGRIFCTGDDWFIVTSPNIDTDLHVESLDGLLSHCWKSNTANHVLTDPGEFFIALTTEIQDVFVDSVFFDTPTNVLGSRSIIRYEADCDNPFSFTFDGGASKQADTYAWFIDDLLVSNDMNYTHDFDQTGDFIVYLETTHNPDVACRPHRDSTEVHIREVRANINVTDMFCAGVPQLLDASNSEDAGGGCEKFVWQFDGQRPRSTTLDTIEHVFDAGTQEISLTAIDINGCEHTVSKTINVSSITAGFDLDSTLCLSSPVQLTDLTQSDTSVVAWEWSFGMDTFDIQNPIFEFGSENFDPAFEGDTITIQLVSTDAFGCVDTLSQTVPTYTIVSQIEMDNGPSICVGEVINFTAQDYTDNGSSLDFSWDFQTFGVFDEQNPTVEFTEGGPINAVLNYTEISTGCIGSLDTTINVFNLPVASFISDKDSLDVICFPEQLNFTNTSEEDGPVLYIWDFGNGATSNLENPSIAFDKGVWEVSLIVRSFFGCQDTVRQSFELIGPEGTFDIDKDFVCPGEEIRLSLIDAVDVNSFTWDLGDGVQIDDVNPLTYTYNPQSSISAFTPRLILRANDGGCEQIQALPITISSLEGDFEAASGICPGELSLFTSFDNVQEYFWDIDGTIVEGEPNPSVTITSQDDSLSVFLRVTDGNDCVIERQRNIATPDFGGQLPRFPNVFSPNEDLVNPFFNVVIDPNALDNEIEVTTFKVYNRWGELLYDNESPTQGWNGVYNGEIVPADVYAYFIEVSIDGCDSISKKGSVTVIK